MTHSNKRVLELWLEDLTKLASDCTRTGYMITGGEINKFIVGTMEIVKALVEKTELLPSSEVKSE